MIFPWQTLRKPVKSSNLQVKTFCFSGSRCWTCGMVSGRPRTGAIWLHSLGLGGPPLQPIPQKVGLSSWKTRKGRAKTQEKPVEFVGISSFSDSCTYRFPAKPILVWLCSITFNPFSPFILPTYWLNPNPWLPKHSLFCPIPVTVPQPTCLNHIKYKVAHVNHV